MTVAHELTPVQGTAETVAPPADRLSRACASLLFVGASALAGVALAEVWLLAWLLAVSLLGFLLGPGSLLNLLYLPEPFLLLPPLALTVSSLGVAWWLAANGRLRWATLCRTAPLPAAGLAARPHMVDARWTLGLLAAGCLGYLAYARLVFFFHRLQGGIDEGTWLYPARLAMSGQVPYRDFNFIQGPLFPYVLGLTLGPFDYHEAPARIFAIACTLATLLVTFLAAERLGGRLAGLLAFALLLTNLDFVTHLSAGLSANGSFTALLVALVALALAWERPSIALVLAALATGIRLTFAPLPVIIALYLAFACRRPRLALLGGLAVAGLIFGPFLVLGGEKAVFGLVHQTQRASFVMRLEGLAQGTRFQLIAVRDVTVAVAEAYLPFLLGAIPTLALVWRRQHPRWQVLATLAASSGVLLLVNLLPYPSMVLYPISQLPLLAVLEGVALAVLLHRAVTGSTWRPAFAPLVASLGVLLVAAPLLASRSPTWVEEYRYQAPVDELVEVSTYVRDLLGPEARLLTFETPVASESGLRLLPGLESSAFGFTRRWSDEQARRVGFMTADMLLAMVEQRQADIVVESEHYSFANSDVRFRPALERNYVLRRLFERVSDWGQVRVYTRRPG